MSEYPYYTGSVKENVPSLALNDKTSLKNVHDIVSNDATVGVNAGDVFTGSLNTSHSSYLPQLKQTFKYNEGKPQFLGYKNMNNSGFLSGSRYSSDDIAKYLNTEIDEQIKRGILPANIQRPYAKDNSRILLPHYGIKQGSNTAGKTIGAAEDVRNANGTLNLNAGISPQLIQNFIGPKSNATFPIETKAGVNRYDVPISDPGVELFRKYPFMNKYAKINKQKLMNGKFQWSTTGAGLQNVAEKYGKGVVLGGLGYGAYDAYNYDKNDRNTYLKPSEIKILDDKNYILPESEKPSRAEMFKRGAKEAYESPLEYAKNPFFVNDIYQGLNSTPEEKNGGSIESWEDDLDDEEIRLLKEAGFIVEELK
jgi:hypothetical protein